TPVPFTIGRHLDRTLRLHARLLDSQLDNLQHADSLIQPSEGGNCLNWLLGHVVDSRAWMLRLVGLPASFDAAPYERYKRDSDPIRAAEEALPLEQLRADFGAAQAPLLEWLTTAPPESQDAIPEGSSRSVIEQIAFLVWHEATHLGQLEQFRRLAGRTEKVI
ncbi:MAG: DinB family protein, partial [Caldilineaceae bacterium]